MARIPEQEIERLKREVSVERLAETRTEKRPQARGWLTYFLCIR